MQFVMKLRILLAFQNLHEVNQFKTEVSAGLFKFSDC